MIYVHCADLMLEFFLKLPTHRKETENNTYLFFCFLILIKTYTNIFKGFFRPRSCLYVIQQNRK